MASDTYQRGLERGLKQADAWNQSTCDWTAAARVSGLLMVVDVGVAVDVIVASCCWFQSCMFIDRVA